MSKPVKASPALPVTLTQQKADFTAEGSPPPGKVSASTPVTTPTRPPQPSGKRSAKARHA